MPESKNLIDTVNKDLQAKGVGMRVGVDPAAPGGDTTVVTAVGRGDGQDQVSFHDKVIGIRDTQIAKVMDPNKGKAEKQRKMDLGADKHFELVQIARRYARELSKDGPITIDDVTEEMGKFYNVLPGANGKRQTWKGSVFTKSEWVYVGSVPSRQVQAHSRPVGLWALKTWLATHTLNGRNTHISSYVVSRLFRDFTHARKDVDLKACNWYIGNDVISDEIRQSIKDANNTLYEVPVTFVPGAVGAIIMPPEPKSSILPVGSK